MDCEDFFKAELPDYAADSPLPREDRRPMTRLGRGQKVAVAEYGGGEIRGFDGDKVEVQFADGQLRKFKRQFLEPRRRAGRS